ncbi:MAG TPA: hypothetical protein VFA18_08465, partial [Gemmataceae bacterium]|nr:hypothetical protein [Gemmataceae bacterium]
MVTTLCLFTCALATAQPASSTEWLLRPQLGRGQELVYTGSYTEEVTGRDVRFQRAYHLESRLFVVDTQATGFDVA